MGRGAQAQTQQMIDQQVAQQSNMNQQLYGSSQALGSQAATGYQEPAGQSRLHAGAAIGDHQRHAIRAVVVVQCAGAKRRQSRRAHPQFRGLRRADRFAGAHAGTGSGQPGAAKSNRVRQCRAFGHAVGALRTFRTLRHGLDAAGPRVGRQSATPGRQRAQRRQQRIQPRPRARRIVVRVQELRNQQGRFFALSGRKWQPDKFHHTLQHESRHSG